MFTFEHFGEGPDDTPCQAPQPEIFLFTEFRFCSIACSVLARQKGRFAIVTSAGQAAVDAAASARDVMAGRAIPVRRCDPRYDTAQ